MITRRLWLEAIGLVFCMAMVLGCDDESPSPTESTPIGPAATFTVTPEAGRLDTAFQFDASGSSDTQDPTAVLEVRWDWENDGVWDTPRSTTKTATHKYATAGTKTVKLEATNAAGLTDTEDATVMVGAPGLAPESFVLIHPGTFSMGSPASELCRDAEEAQHEVVLTRAFYLLATEVSQAQWQATMGWDESAFDGADHPVGNITWFDAIRYCNACSADEGLTAAYTISGATYDGNHIIDATVTWHQDANGFRLPTEAEWEYACRAGSASAFCNGGISQCQGESEPYLGLVGWYRGNSNRETHDVGQKSPNAWGLRDMHGNAAEWCWDWYGSFDGASSDPAGPESGTYRVWRGGSYSYDAQGCRSASRAGAGPGSRYSGLGLRLARTAM